MICSSLQSWRSAKMTRLPSSSRSRRARSSRCRRVAAEGGRAGAQVGVDQKQRFQPARPCDLVDPRLQRGLVEAVFAAGEEAFELPELAAGFQERLGEPAPLAGVEAFGVADQECALAPVDLAAAAVDGGVRVA